MSNCDTRYKVHLEAGVPHALMIATCSCLFFVWLFAFYDVSIFSQFYKQSQLAAALLFTQVVFANGQSKNVFEPLLQRRNKP